MRNLNGSAEVECGRHAACMASATLHAWILHGDNDHGSVKYKWVQHKKLNLWSQEKDRHAHSQRMVDPH